MIKKTVVIGSEEFKNAVLAVIKQAKNIIDDIENPRFERLYDGWIKDLELGIEWGLGSSESMTFTKAEEYCKSLGGRLPTVDELNSIIDRSVHSPACDKKVFKDMKSEYYWTSDKYVASLGYRWVVGFNLGGLVLYRIEDDFNYARPVRASQC